MRISHPTRFGMRISFGGSLGVSRNRAAVIVANDGVIEFDGVANLYEGTVMRVEGGHLVFGANLIVTKIAAIGATMRLSWATITCSGGTSPFATWTGIRYSGRMGSRPTLLSAFMWKPCADRSRCRRVQGVKYTRWVHCGGKGAFD